MEPTRGEGGEVGTRGQLWGDYELLEKLGEGGMGVVYKARHRQTLALGAVKIASYMVQHESVLTRRFEREYTVAQRLRHPHLVQALEFGWQQGVPYLVMEYVPGPSLRQRLRDHGPLSLPEALRVFREVAEATAYLHDNHLIHRDVSPGNIFLHDNGLTKLGDLGIIKDGKASQLLTKPRVGLGTTDFSAPEQIENARDAEPSFDLYSLAVSMYVSLAGKFPFGVGGLLKIVRRKLSNHFVPISELMTVPPALDDLLCRCMDADPARRPRRCVEFLDVLTHCAALPTPTQSDVSTAQAAAVAEKRLSTRHTVQLRSTYDAMFEKSRNTEPALVLNLSRSGICLQVGREFAPDSILQIRVEENLDTDAWHLVRVRWARKADGNEWKLGCSFVRPLVDAEFENLLGLGTPTRQW